VLKKEQTSEVASGAISLSHQSTLSSASASAIRRSSPSR
jgi:hypothetical protein